MTEPWNIDGLAVARAIAGDREVLGGVLGAVERPLYRYISKLVTRPEMAEDVLQEVLFRICRKIGWLRDPELLRPWAFRIASRECFRQLRSERRRGEERTARIRAFPRSSLPVRWRLSCQLLGRRCRPESGRKFPPTTSPTSITTSTVH